jgi:N-acetyl-anhydromuramoyl-L-alanine amidase
VITDQIDVAGWLADARHVLSPNCDARPAECAIELVVVHAISLPPGRFGGREIEALFTNQLNPDADPYFSTIARLRVSAHCLVRRDGELVQFVSLASRAWHAGVSRWGSRERCNDFSIGIELEGTDDSAFERAQYDRLARLIATLKAVYPIRAVLAHSDIATGRKADPGVGFDWNALASRL